MDTNGQLKTVQDIKTRTVPGQCSPVAARKSKLPKTHKDYWASRLRKRTYVNKGGGPVEIPTWQVRMEHGGKEVWFNLNSANQTAAAAKARDIYVFLKANGWPATLAKFKPQSDAVPRVNVTVGEFLKAVKECGALELRTFLNYQSCFLTLVSEAFGLKGDNSKYDYKHGGNQKWRARIDAIRLERFTPTRVKDWQRKRLKQAGTSPVALASAKRSANTYVRSIRSLFTKEIRSQLKNLVLPAVLPFQDVELFENGSMKYVSKVDVQSLIADARTELKTNDPECYKTFLLGLCAGMRRGEIDNAEWTFVDWKNCIIRLVETDFLHLKTQDSAGAITVDREVLAELRALKPTNDAKFIIESKAIWGKPGHKVRTRIRPARIVSGREYVRCKPVFDRLNKWLRSKGVTARKPLHELRKEVGALVATQHGIFAAATFLRHADISTTSRHYACHKNRISVGLGKLLDPNTGPQGTVALPAIAA